MRYVTCKQDVPQIPHFAVLVFAKRYVEADQRSTDCPGHGYPAHWVPTIEYLSFDSQPELLNWMSKNPNVDCQVIDARPRKVETTFSISLP